MARLFDDAIPQYLNVDSPVVTGYPFAFVGWFNSDDLTTEQTIIWCGDKDVTSKLVQLAALGTGAGDPLRCFIYQQTGGAHNISTTTTGYSANTWFHACAICVSASHTRALIDGGSKGVDTAHDSKYSMADNDRTSIGRMMRSAPIAPFSGKLAEVAVYNLSGYAGATDSDRADSWESGVLPALAAGASPLLYPLGLTAYWPCGGRYPEADSDLVGSYSMSPTGSPTWADHPRIYYPQPRKVRLFLSAALPAAAFRVIGSPLIRRPRRSL